MKTIKLYNGVEMPQMGYGVFQVSPEECERCVSDALEVGYRMIDTAQAYQNEEGVGRAWKKSGIRREDMFLVSKIWFTNYGYEQAKASIVVSSEDADNVDYYSDHFKGTLAAILGMTGAWAQMPQPRSTRPISIISAMGVIGCITSHSNTPAPDRNIVL